MPEYAILRFEKHRGGAGGSIEAHHERRKESYASNPDIDLGRSNRNFHIIEPQGRYRNEIENRITASGCKVRSNSIRFVDTLITASPEFFKGKGRDDVRLFFQTAAGFMGEKIGAGNIVSAVVHMDEKTPHLHLIFVPLTGDGRLSAKEIIGNRQTLSKWQDEYYAKMVRAFPDLERGKLAAETGRKHIPTRVLKQAVHLTKEFAEIQGAIGAIGMLNAGKQKEAVIEKLIKILPQLEDFYTWVKGYRKRFIGLEKDNAALTKQVAGLKGKIGELNVTIGNMEYSHKEDTKTIRWENLKLAAEVQNLKRYIEKIPDDIKQEIKKRMRQRDRSLER